MPQKYDTWTPRREATVEHCARLTARQFEIVKFAHENGYFEMPPKTDQREIAAHFELIQSTVSDHLRAATRKIVGSYIAEAVEQATCPLCGDFIGTPQGRRDLVSHLPNCSNPNPKVSGEIGGD